MTNQGIPAGMDPVQALYELGFSKEDAKRFVDWHARELTEKLALKLRTKAGQLAILRSEDARLKAEGLRMGAKIIEAET